MPCDIVYSHRIMFTRFGTCEVHGWAGRWRYFGRERRDARLHAEKWAEGGTPQFTETVTSDPYPPINWRIVAASAATTAPLTFAASWLVTR
jgi:hypothetical protein